MINNKGYDGAKADLWSCGVILFVLMAGYLPFEDSNLVALYKKASLSFLNLYEQREEEREKKKNNACHLFSLKLYTLIVFPFCKG